VPRSPDEIASNIDAAMLENITKALTRRLLKEKPE